MKKLLTLLVCIGLLSACQAKPAAITSPLTTTITPARIATPASFIVYGYLPYWTANTANLPAALTDVSFFSIPIHTDGHVLTLQKPADPGYTLMQKNFLEDLRKEAPGKKISLTLTMMDQDEIETFLATPSAMPTLIADLQTLLTTHPLDGLNFDIEYIRATNTTQRAQFTALLKNIYTDLKPKFPTLNISIAVLADSATRPRLTDIEALSPYTDHMVIMAYDFHRKGSSQSGANAPLYGDGDETWGKNIMASAKAFTDLVPARKLILGIPFYGYEWSVTDTQTTNFTLPGSGRTATYERITNLIAEGQATRYFDPISYTPYLFYKKNNQQQQIYYEDAQSLSYKLDLVKQAGFGGIAIWALGYEGQTTELWQQIENSL